MNSLIYVLKTGWKNKLKKSLRKPGFWIYIILIGLYLVIMGNSFYSIVVEGGFDNAKTLVMVLTGIQLYFGPMSYISYAKRKGLRFLPCDVHFLFTAPISPKLLLIYAMVSVQIMGLFLEVLILILGVAWFHVSPLVMFAYFIGITCFSLFAEACLVICLYGNERFSERTMKWISSALWLVLGCLAAVTAVYIYLNGFSFQTFLGFLLSDWICYIPVFGWQTAFIRLILLGPGVAQIIGTICYLLFAVVIFVLAKRMRCTGEYYEKAMEFADDFQQLMDKKKKGDVSGVKVGKVNRKATVSYKGSGAKAVFFRQLLEYKKSRYFIFGGQTLLGAVVAVGFPVLVNMGKIHIEGIASYYAIFGVMAYIFLIFSGYQTKWEKELENPYVFLIPASTFSKMWYATLIEHIRSAVDVLIMAVPYCLVLKLPYYYILLIVLGGAAMKAVKLYSDTICNVLIGSYLGNTARMLLRMLISWTLIGIAVPVVIVVHFLIGPVIAVACGCVYLLVASVALMFGGSYAFSRMEIRD